ncbi:MAG TPA: thioredoxin-disulfide reductase [Candidatus Limnocylindrales bacterium]
MSDNDKTTTPAPGRPFGGLSIDFSGSAPGSSIAFDTGAIRPPTLEEPDAETGAGPIDAKVVIVGSGPAGLTAAIYAARANLEPLVLAGSAPGGQLMLTSDVENYPGFPEGIQGPELMALFRAQAERFGTRVIDVDVDRVDLSERPFRLWARGTEYRAQTVIVATGASALWLGLPSETRLRGQGVSACATCDGFFFKGQEIAVVGGGDSALEEASYLTRFASRVHLLHRRDAFRGSKIMIARVLANPAIEVHYDTTVEEVLGDGHVEGLRVRDINTGKERTLPISGLFIAIGHRPNTAAFAGWLSVDGKGYLTVEEHTMSEIPGIFIAGDVHDHRYRQAVTAAGEGAAAAIDAERWLEVEGVVEARARAAV